MDDLVNSALAAQDSPTGERFPERRYHMGRTRNGNHRYSRRRHTRILYLLGGLSSVLFLLLLIVSVRLSLYAKELHDLTLLQRKQEKELELLRPRVISLESKIADLVQGRLPGLHPLEFDKVIPIDKEYVRNIIFTLIGKAENRNYEYKLTLKNNGLTAVHPIVRVVFFDQVGIQVGSSTIGVDEGGVPTLDVLEREEVRSYTHVVDLADSKEAKYFLVEVDLPEYQKLHN